MDRIQTAGIAVFDDVVAVEEGTAVVVDLVLGLGAVHVGLAEGLHRDGLEGHQESVDAFLRDAHGFGQQDVGIVVHRQIGTEAKEIASVQIDRRGPVFSYAVDGGLFADAVPCVDDFLGGGAPALLVDEWSHLVVV